MLFIDVFIHTAPFNMFLKGGAYRVCINIFYAIFCFRAKKTKSEPPRENRKRKTTLLSKRKSNRQSVFRLSPTNFSFLKFRLFEKFLRGRARTCRRTRKRKIRLAPAEYPRVFCFSVQLKRPRRRKRLFRFLILPAARFSLRNRRLE